MVGVLCGCDLIDRSLCVPRFVRGIFYLFLNGFLFGDAGSAFRYFAMFFSRYARHRSGLFSLELWYYVFCNLDLEFEGFGMVLLVVLILASQQIL